MSLSPAAAAAVYGVVSRVFDGSRSVLRYFITWPCRPSGPSSRGRRRLPYRVLFIIFSYVYLYGISSTLLLPLRLPYAIYHRYNTSRVVRCCLWIYTTDRQREREVGKKKSTLSPRAGCPSSVAHARGAART